MMTQDRSSGQLAAPILPRSSNPSPPDGRSPPIAPTSHHNPSQAQQDFPSLEAAPTSPRNLNPSAPAFRQSQGVTPTSPKNLNPSAPVFRQSQAGDRSLTEGAYSVVEAGTQGLLTNGDIHTNGASFMVPQSGNGTGVHRGVGTQQQGASQVQGSTSAGGVTLSPHPLLANQSNHQMVVAPQQGSYTMAATDVSGQQARVSNQESAPAGNGSELVDTQANGAVGEEETCVEELEGAVGGEEYRFPDEVLAPIRKQMQFYFSTENLPNDKFLNQNMDTDKFIPLEIFLDFGRIKPICDTIEKLIQAIESSSILELSEDKKKVRVSQCRKTLTLRGFPASTTEEDVRQFVLEMGAYPPTHIEFVMFKEKMSVWYVSFQTETAALNSFFTFHNQRSVYKGYPIGCCIKSSGTMAAAGYFPSMEESNQRRLAQQSQVVAAAAVPAVPSSIPQQPPQQPQALMQPYGTIPLHSFMTGSPPGIYYQQQAPYMPYMTGMLPGWPGTTTMDPGIIMQNNGLQPQNIRTPIPRSHMIPPGGGAQHRYTRPQRARQNNLERSASERPADRPPGVSVSSGPLRSSPRSADGSTSTTVVSQGANMPRRVPTRDEIPSVMNPPQAVTTPHQYITPLVTQQQQPQHVVTTSATTALVNQSILESMTGPTLSHFQTAQQHHHQQTMMAQAALTSTATVPPPPAPQTNNPPPITQPQIIHHHHQPPPPVPQQQQHPLHQQPPQALHHHHHHQQHHQQQPHQHHQPPPPPQQPPHHQQPHQAGHHQQHHHTHHQHMMPPPHHPQQSHPHQMPPPQTNHHHQQHHQQQQHQQPIPGNRPERRNRRRREENVRNQRGGERNQSNRANFSQAPAAADNFTMEANSFPPLPGAANSITSSEISLENRMSDIVRGISRNTVSGNTGTPKAPSTTPSPVATPLPPSVMSGTLSNQHHGHGVMTSPAVDDGDSAQDDDTTSSSQEEVDTDGNSLDSRSVRSEPQPVSLSSEPSAIPVQPRSQKTNTPVASPAMVSAQRQQDNRQGPTLAQAQPRGPQQAIIQQQQMLVSPASSVASGSSAEAPKLSYAQILLQKNREANNASNGDNTSTGGMTSNSNSGTSNGPSVAHNSANAAAQGAGRAPNQANNAFREHGNYQGSQQQQGSRSSMRGPSKDNMARSDGPPPASRTPNNRRNSKENRSTNKYERRKPENRQK